MSAKDLEEFIKVIETAESVYSLSNRPSSVISYSTDIFGSSNNNQPDKKVNPKPQGVPSLWHPKNGSDFLGSSWGSTSTAGYRADTESKRSGVTSATSPQKTTSDKSSSPLVSIKVPLLLSKAVQADSNRSSTMSSDGQSKDRSNRSSTMSSDGQSKDRSNRSSTMSSDGQSKDRILSLQSHSKFARVTAKDLSPASSPKASPSPVRRSQTTRTAKPITTPDSNSSRRKSKSPSSSSSSASSPLEQSASSSGSVIEIIKDNDVGSPRPPPKPRPQITIRQNTVKLHNHNAKLPKQLKIDDSKLPEKLKPRSTSVPGTPRRRKTRMMKPQDPPELVDLRSYSKSLRLLGLEIPSNRKEATLLTSHNAEIQTKSPTMRTRLRERTQSVTSLQEVIDSKEKIAKKEFFDIKDSLKRAVFEEWYFRKLSEEKRRRRREEEEKENKEYEEELEKEEKRKNSEEAFKKWLKHKKDKEVKMTQKGKENNEKLEEDKVAKQERILKSQQEWIERKNQEMALKVKKKFRLMKKKEEMEKKQEEKREKSKKEFLAWKKEVDEKLRDRDQKQKEFRMIQLEEMKEKARAKKEEAEAAFNGWKRKKDEDRVAMKTTKTTSEVAPKEDEEAKRQEAMEAYASWLTFIEQREIEKQCQEDQKILRHLFRPPWYPAGAAEI